MPKRLQNTWQVSLMSYLANKRLWIVTLHSKECQEGTKSLICFFCFLFCFVFFALLESKGVMFVKNVSHEATLAHKRFTSLMMKRGSSSPPCLAQLMGRFYLFDYSRFSLCPSSVCFFERNHTCISVGCEVGKKFHLKSKILRDYIFQREI